MTSRKRAHRHAALLAALAFAAITTIAGADLATAVQDQFTSAGLSQDARLAVMVTRAATGERLVEIDTDTPMKPASTTKLFSASAAVDILGADYRTRTIVETDGVIEEDGTLYGSIIVRGGGDPGLGPRFQDAKYDVTKVMREWAVALKKQGVLRVTGDVVGDDALFTGSRTGIGWYPDEAAEWYMAEIGALTFNDGCVDLHFTANDKVGKPTDVKMVPDVGYFTFKNSVEVAPPETPGVGTVSLFRHDDEGRHIATGSVPKGRTRTRWTAVGDPARFTAAVLLDEMRKQGIVVDGTYKSASLPSVDIPPVDERTTLISHSSEPLATILEPILANSQNLYSECIARLAAIEAGNGSDFEAVAKTVTDWAGENGLRRNGFLVTDGSGLSSLNRIPARSLNDLLLRMHRDESNGTLLRQSLARPGERGSLSSRLPELTGRLSAKTGSLGDTSTIAGFLTTKKGDDLVVVVMIDSTSGAEAVLDRLVLLLDRMLSGEPEERAVVVVE